MCNGKVVWRGRGEEILGSVKVCEIGGGGGLIRRGWKSWIGWGEGWRIVRCRGKVCGEGKVGKWVGNCDLVSGWIKLWLVIINCVVEGMLLGREKYRRGW